MLRETIPPVAPLEQQRTQVVDWLPFQEKLVINQHNFGRTLFRECLLLLKLNVCQNDDKYSLIFRIFQLLFQ